MIERNLRKLLAPWGIPNVPMLDCRNMTLTSSSVTSGDLFIAIIGHKTDGRLFITQAIDRGAIAVLAEAECQAKDGHIEQINKIPIIYISQLSQRLSALSGRFYQQPAYKLKLIGVTGTNGKTTTTHLIAQWANLLGENSAIMGTIGNGIYGNLIASKNTTDSAVVIQQVLYDLVKKNTNLVAMEISSHSLVQHRVHALPFVAAVFTNLSQDHLDYHHNMAEYESAKWLLFSQHKINKAIINADDKIGRQWINKIPNAVVVTSQKIFQFKFYQYWLHANNIYYHDNGTFISFNSSWGNGNFKSQLIGEFNSTNILLALATMLTLNYPLELLIDTAIKLQPICGRMERFTAPDKPLVIVDYAHTPDALEKALKTARIHYCKKGGYIWCVFGCGGERDRDKRPLMGAIVEKLTDIVIITNDNPRNEKSMFIINDILSGMIQPKRARIILNRKQAVTSAIIEARVNDLVLIFGKGHENYQIIGNEYIHYSDRDIVTKLLEIKT
ncbi:UDP-N-acetylmuramoyl-L-alanyl-D-glutamate--2,6-diaminopimelate ligase [Pantoea sp. Mhis]|uniref:UDP-N-acetylmuramoyl-L-alanyl-D-glutamate--2, 6-diaminopimelate ligase n=1 Tax=Pantoea sp. Mhis TaxID=2576759 RepID=UPI001356FFB8|nr:UDP-N-acetylmuramoyl-L-alanyl-D-glutamate--2,6-diaminopimelate ligase [Pantoea sp. Mhis]MXP56490.1 UDP-N-acetylmuramoyl-L-alanyl-D-glutamate--2,6-diaminopimelate ligase [Pantoea sp. Mhis]